MPTQNVNLTPELDLFVKAQVATGYFNNASEVHRAALSVLAREHEEQQLKLERLRMEIQLGLNDLDAGRATSIKNKSQLRTVVRSAFNRATEGLEATNAERAG